MAGQGKTILSVSHALKQANWSVVYVCIPNTPHHQVVSISVKKGTCKQRYPDILAYSGDITRLIEVETKLDDAVAYDINTRFNEMVESLKDVSYWNLWRQQIENVTGFSLPEYFLPKCDLVICNQIKTNHLSLIEYLSDAGISVSSQSQIVL